MSAPRTGQQTPASLRSLSEKLAKQASDLAKIADAMDMRRVAQITVLGSKGVSDFADFKLPAFVLDARKKAARGRPSR